MSLALHDTDRTVEITRPLAEFAMSLRFGDLPGDVVEISKHCFLDWLGVTIAGSKEPLTQILRDQIMTDGGAPQATITGDGRKAGARGLVRRTFGVSLVDLGRTGLEQ